MSPESIIEPLPIDRSAKANAWDIFHAAQTPEDLQSGLDNLPLTKQAKSDLWDLKAAMWDSGQQSSPAASDPAATKDYSQPTQVNHPVTVSPAMPAPPEITGLIQPGNVDLTNRPRVQNPDGSVSTVRSISFGENGKEILVPTVSDDGRIMSNEDAISNYHNTGKHLGIFDGPDNATAYAQQLHKDQEKLLEKEPLPSVVAPHEIAPEAPKPAKPNEVQRVSPVTPNPPTAAQPTEPESPATINIQMGQLTTGQRRVVMFPKGQGIPDLASIPAGVSLHHDSFGNVYAYRPDLIRKSTITGAAARNKLTQILGGPLGMGAPDKSAIQGNPITVVARSADGTEAQTTVTDQVNLPNTLRATYAVTPPGGAVSIEDPQAVLNKRRTP